MSTGLKNPYIGPQPFKTGEPFYGRDWEILDLLDLLIADRIVLLYSPSGAGKTSLIQAGLFPKLQRKGFHTLPVIRVSLMLSPEQIPELPSEYNRYVLSSLLSLEKELPEDAQTPIGELAGMTFSEYLARRQDRGTPEPDSSQAERLPLARRRNVRLMLIFDQFEEVLTSDPTDQALKTEFFSQVGTVLQQPDRWALFSMREEYAVGLEPYLQKLPTHLSTTFRLELLREEAAYQAMQRPARDAEVIFSDAAARRLFEDLCKVRIQQPNGPPIERQGLYVEPVQLQIVCHRLWEKLPTGAAEIGKGDIEGIKDVHNALADYYSDRVGTVAQTIAVREREIREWFDRQLITEQGIRGQVLKGPQQSQGLDNQVIELLVDAHLVRAEKRLNATWYELAHDRLIEPVRRNNAEWFQEHLSPLQRQADLWETQNRSNGLLLRDKALEKAEHWAVTHQDELTSTEYDFLSACRELRARIQKERRKNRLIRGWAITAMSIALIALFLFVKALIETENANYAEKIAQGEAKRAIEAQKNAAVARKIADDRRKEAEQLRRVALVKSLVALAPQRIQPYPEDERSALLLRQAYLFTQEVEKILTQEEEKILKEQVKEALLKVLSVPYFRNVLRRGHEGTVWSVAFSPKGRRILASGNDHGTVRLWDFESMNSTTLGEPKNKWIDIVSVAFHPDGKILASGSEDGLVQLWDVTNPKAVPRTVSKISLNQITDGALTSPHDVSAEPYFFGERLYNPVVFSPVPVEQILVTTACKLYSFRRCHLRLWKLKNSSSNGIASQGILPFPPRVEGFTSIAFSPNGQILGGGASDGSLYLWDRIHPISTEEASIPAGYLKGLNRWGEELLSFETTIRSYDEKGFIVTSLAFSPDGQNLVEVWEPKEQGTKAAKASKSPASLNVVRLWNLQNSEPTDLFKHKGFIRSVAFSPDSLTIAVGSNNYSSGGSGDNAIRLWDLRDSNTEPTIFHLEWGVTSLTFSPENHILAAGNQDGTVTLWNLIPLSLAKPIKLNRDDHKIFSKIAFSSDLYTLATISEDGAVQVWYRTSSPATPIPLSDYEGPVPIPLSNYEGSGISIAISPKGKILALGSKDGIIRLWDLTSRTIKPISPPGSKKAITSAVFGPEGKILAAGREDGFVQLWDLTGTAAPPVILKNSFKLTEQSFENLKNEDIPDNILENLKPIIKNHEFTIEEDKFLNQVKEHLGEEQTVKYKKLILKHAQERSEVCSLAFSSDKSILAVGRKDGSITLRRNLSKPFLFSDWKHWEKPLNRHERKVHTLSFSPNNQKLASSSEDGTVRLWYLSKSGKTDDSLSKDPFPSTGLHGHEGRILSFAFSPDGHTLVAGSSDHTIRWWNLRDPTASPIVLYGHKSRVISVSFSSDNKTLVSIGSDKKILTWITDPEKLVEIVCQKVWRNLTMEEWDQFIGPDIPYERTCPKLPVHPSVLEAGQNLAQEGNLEGAINIFQRVLDLEPENEEATAQIQSWFETRQASVLEVGQNLAKDGDLKGAINIFQIVLDLKPEDKEVTAQIQSWIEALQAGENPFAPEVPDESKNE